MHGCIYRDALMLVLDKPAGSRSIRGRRAAKSSKTVSIIFASVCRAIRRSRIGSIAILRAASCSGAIIRRWRSWALFKQGKIGKTYCAIVEGAPDRDEGLIDLPLGRLDANRGWWMKVDPEGQPAQTRWRVLARGDAMRCWR